MVLLENVLMGFHHIPLMTKYNNIFNNKKFTNRKRQTKTIYDTLDTYNKRLKINLPKCFFLVQFLHLCVSISMDNIQFPKYPNLWGSITGKRDKHNSSSVLVIFCCYFLKSLFFRLNVLSISLFCPILSSYSNDFFLSFNSISFY